MLYPSGSEWRKWDLHIHSPLSILNNQFSKKDGQPDWEAYIQKLEGLDISVLGVTDYFTIDGYKQLLEFKKNGRLKNIDLILPNIEFRLDKFIGKDNKRLNFHVIFSNEVEPQAIEDNFLHDLKFVFDAPPHAQEHTGRLRVSDLEKLGRQLKQENPGKFKGSEAVVGANMAVVDLKSIKDILSESKVFANKHLLILSVDNMSDLEWFGQDHQTRKNIVQTSDMVFSSNPNDIQWCLGKTYETVKDFVTEFATIKPCIHGSDAHEEFFMGHPCAKRGEKHHDCKKNTNECELRYCWIKADPTFEGLKQVLYEPEARVRIQSNNPSPSRHNYTIRGFSIGEAQINENLSIKGTDLNLNPNLIAITGGKGAGKTALVDLIANCFENRLDTSDSNSFVKRIKDETEQLHSEIQFLNAEGFAKKIKEKKYIAETEISYISQGALETYISDDSTLSNRIAQLIFESPTVANTYLEYEFNELTSNVDFFSTKVEELSNQIIALELETSSQIIEEKVLEKKRYETELNDIERKIKESKTQITEEAKEQAQLQQDEITLLKTRRDKLDNLKQILTRLNRSLGSTLFDINRDIQTANELIGQLGLSMKFPEISYDRVSIDESIKTLGNDLKEVISKIEQKQKSYNNLTEQVLNHTKLLNQRTDIITTLQQTKEEFTRLDSLQSEKEEKISQRKQFLQNQLFAIHQLQKKYAEIIATFSNETARVLNDLHFFAEIRFAKAKLFEFAEDLFDNRVVNTRDEKASDFNQLSDFCIDFIQMRENSIDNLVNEIEQISKSHLSEKIKKSRTTDIHDFHRFLYSNYFSVVPTVKYKNTSLPRLSLGQKATVLIKIYLAQGDKPIIIDSHDDHLDNQYIMDELIDSIREAKKFRQIIIVSNNGNVVVNTDAEQIIIAERENTQISFISGSLENPQIREKALNVLEGGEEAFKKRQQKYRLER